MTERFSPYYEPYLITLSYDMIMRIFVELKNKKEKFRVLMARPKP